MGIVFISYRRDETAGEARALYNDLTSILGPGRVFMDVDDIALGQDFRRVLEQRLDACEMMLVLIGKTWPDAADGTGARRLDNPGDFVRLEVATALRRNVPVTPLLLQGARMPDARQLPDDLKDLAYRNGFELSHLRWESDVHELVRRLGLAPGAAAALPASALLAAAAVPAPPAPVPMSAPQGNDGARAPSASGLRLGVIAALVVALAGAAWWALKQRHSQPASEAVATARPAAAAAPTPAPLAAPVAAAAPAPVADIAPLIAELDDANPEARDEAADKLTRLYAHSSDAIGQLLKQLAPATFNQLRGGRLQVLRVLNATDDDAWTPTARAQAVEAVQRLRGAIASGRWNASGQASTELERLGKRMGV